MPHNDLIKEFEGCSLNPYLCPAGVPTIGWGTTRYEDGTPVKIGDPAIDQDRADYLLELEVARVRVRLLANYGTMPQNERQALVSFAYNLGVPALLGSTLWRKYKGQDRKGAAGQFGRWVYAGGRKLTGLVRRRAAEKERFLL